MEVRRAGLSALRCHAQPGDRRERQEIPTWMFDQAACSRMQVARDPRASWSALLDLQRLLNATRLEQTPDTVQRPPHSKEAGTDVTATTYIEALATNTVSTSGPGSTVECSADRCSARDNQTGRRVASGPTRGKSTGAQRVRRAQGGKR